VATRASGISMATRPAMAGRRARIARTVRRKRLHQGRQGEPVRLSAIQDCLNDIRRARLEVLGERLDGGNVVLRRIRADSRPLPGTRLVREYDGVQHVVTVRADDFEFEGRPYRSLSAIAQHITGTRWNG
jgi:hypothetical protein